MGISQIKNLIEKLRVFEQTVFTITERIVRQYEPEILDLNTQDQLFGRGIDSEGNTLGTYSPITVEIKRAKGQPYNRITLRDEGDFYDGFRLVYSPTGFRFESEDDKTDMLKSMFGENIFGLTQDSIEEMVEEYIRPELVTIIRNEIL